MANRKQLLKRLKEEIILLSDREGVIMIMWDSLIFYRYVPLCIYGNEESTVRETTYSMSHIVLS